MNGRKPLQCVITVYEFYLALA